MNVVLVPGKGYGFSHARTSMQDLKCACCGTVEDLMLCEKLYNRALRTKRSADLHKAIVCRKCVVVNVHRGGAGFRASRHMCCDAFPVIHYRLEFVNDVAKVESDDV